VVGVGGDWGVGGGGAGGRCGVWGGGCGYGGRVGRGEGMGLVG